MKTNVFKLANQLNKYALYLVLAFSFLGFLHPRDLDSGGAGYRVNLVKPNGMADDDNSWYIPARSPAFNDLLGS
jgi:hypothetical protein